MSVDVKNKKHEKESNFYNRSDNNGIIIRFVQQSISTYKHTKEKRQLRQLLKMVVIFIRLQDYKTTCQQATCSLVDL